MLKIPDLQDFSEKLGTTKSKLINYVNKVDRFYKTFKIKKRSGSKYRIINAPSKELKGIQRWISEFLLSEIPFSPASTAFFPGSSILKNAEAHKSSAVIFNLDLENFFPSISFERISGILDKFGIKVTPRIAICKLLTLNGSLPQGAPSSPRVANIVCFKMDMRILGLCKKYNVTYTRYADDLTFSGNKIPKSFIKYVREIISQEGFKINENKVWIRRKSRQQLVTGLVVNDVPSIPRQKRKRIRAMFHQASINPAKFRHRIDELTGYLGFLNMVQPNYSQIPKYKDVLNSLKK